MASSHSKTHEPNAMSNGFVRLVIIVSLGLLASLLWNACGNSLGTAGHGHGEGHASDHTATSGTGHAAAPEATATSYSSPAGKVDTATGDFIYETGKTVTINLPNNAGALQVGEYSTENKLYKFLSDTTQLIDTVKGNWFELTNIKFKTGGITMDSSSLQQIKNIAAISKAFPKAQFKVGGYTDNSGDSTNNVLLSQRRADVVLSELKKAGVGAASLSGAKGYGPEHPVGDNATAAGKAMNRRVAINIKAK